MRPQVGEHCVKDTKEEVFSNHPIISSLSQIDTEAKTAYLVSSRRAAKAAAPALPISMATTSSPSPAC